jgi:endonuclease III
MHEADELYDARTGRLHSSACSYSNHPADSFHHLLKPSNVMVQHAYTWFCGLSYRAKFIVGSVQQLLAKPGGGQAWLLSLRDKPYNEAHEALCSLPGVGPKVAACICLFSLDKVGAEDRLNYLDEHVRRVVLGRWKLCCVSMRCQLPTGFAALHDCC